MTPVRQDQPAATSGKARKSAKSTTKLGHGGAAAGRVAKKREEGRAARGKGQGATSGSKVAQVRLQADEVADLEMVVRHLNLGSTSEALREGLRLLVREAAEERAAEEIRAYYHGEQASRPDGVVPATEAELRAADDTQW
ncbi:hypothetical protein [Micromonospora mirobrigensis]|uniref:hypothetical protein n=1 Tax=Micromonospora mirobrigensis TaxID=262898 RepID=UPI001FE0CA94|nr:hypothetical protein [Micromonospora mirobrigensis]